MPAIATIDTLPPEVRQQLFHRLHDAGHGNIVAISKWLSGMGYQVGKSALGEYSKKHRDRINAECIVDRERQAEMAFRESDVRLALLEVCAIRPLTSGTILDDAKELLAWVKDPSSPDGSARS